MDSSFTGMLDSASTTGHGSNASKGGSSSRNKTCQRYTFTKRSQSFLELCKERLFWKLLLKLCGKGILLREFLPPLIKGSITKLSDPKCYQFACQNTTFQSNAEL